ncbi:hypothetical protein [Clostridium fungisolvens]|uniref:Lipoprotein n=1 Tax=Clostridium fungisolvens TaxID=1604897 RepID=A0A6V8SLT5_9CLOT|nr:hypothetical protein [Clostridium fungisolvens]GFP78204.1 hypothetical protein bsdtw1_04399 [Clostridium fungisolvens]
MRKRIYSFIFKIILLLICSLPLISCEAINAQKITNTSTNPGLNGGNGFNNNPSSKFNGPRN